MSCGYVPMDTMFLSGILSYVDCQAQTIGERGYLALAAQGSVVSLILTTLLTILIALIGYRLMLGHVPGLEDGVLTLVKIGIVIALATNWQAYRTLFYDVALNGPAELAAVIGVPSGLPGASGGLATHLDIVDQQYQRLAADRTDLSTSFQPQAQDYESNNTKLSAPRLAYLIGVTTAFAVVRLTVGLLLALGPLFIPFLLFDNTRGLFEGWLRVLAGAALGALATTIISQVELALMEPWLADLIARRAAGVPIAGAPAQLLAASLMFDVVLLAVICGVARVASGLRLGLHRLSSMDQQTVRRDLGEIPVSTSTTMRASFIDNRSRAAAIVDAITVAERREVTSNGASRTQPATLIPTGTTTSRPSAFGLQELGSPRGANRRTSTRVSASAGLRDKAQ